MFALDRANGVLPTEIFEYMIRKGADITERDSVSVKNTPTINVPSPNMSGAHHLRWHCTVSLSKTHLSLLSTGSTQEDPS